MNQTYDYTTFIPCHRLPTVRNPTTLGNILVALSIHLNLLRAYGGTRDEQQRHQVLLTKSPRRPQIPPRENSLPFLLVSYVGIGVFTISYFTGHRPLALDCFFLSFSFTVVTRHELAHCIPWYCARNEYYYFLYCFRSQIPHRSFRYPHPDTFWQSGLFLLFLAVSIRILRLLSTVMLSVLGPLDQTEVNYYKYCIHWAAWF